VKAIEHECSSADNRILRFREVVKKTGLSRSTVYGRIRTGEFPSPVPLGPRAVGFIADEVEGWLSERMKSRCIHA
jgi:prophage regulatory protein